MKLRKIALSVLLLAKNTLQAPKMFVFELASISTLIDHTERYQYAYKANLNPGHMSM